MTTGRSTLSRSIYIPTTGNATPAVQAPRLLRDQACSPSQQCAHPPMYSCSVASCYATPGDVPYFAEECRHPVTPIIRTGLRKDFTTWLTVALRHRTQCCRGAFAVRANCNHGPVLRHILHSRTPQRREDPPATHPCCPPLHYREGPSSQRPGPLLYFHLAERPIYHCTTRLHFRHQYWQGLAVEQSDQQRRRPRHEGGLLRDKGALYSPCC